MRYERLKMRTMTCQAGFHLAGQMWWFYILDRGLRGNRTPYLNPPNDYTNVLFMQKMASLIPDIYLFSSAISWGYIIPSLHISFSIHWYLVLWVLWRRPRKLSLLPTVFYFTHFFNLTYFCNYFLYLFLALDCIF